MGSFFGSFTIVQAEAVLADFLKGVPAFEPRGPAMLAPRTSRKRAGGTPQDPRGDCGLA